MDVKTRGLRKLPTALTKKGIVLLIEDLKIKNQQLLCEKQDVHTRK